MMSLPLISTYIPIYGRQEQTSNLILNLSSAYQGIAYLDIIIIDCKGDFALDESADSLADYDVALQVVRGKPTDYWGACLNIALRHFKKSRNDYLFISNNDTYHFQECATVMVNTLVQSGCVLCSIGNVEHDDREVIYRTKPSPVSAMAEHVVSVSKSVFFDSKNLSFSPSAIAIPNVAPTVAIAMSRRLIESTGNTLYVPRVIPHYLSDYYFTHELYKCGASLSPEPQWTVLRFKNEPTEMANNSLFSIKSKMYIWAWIAFFLRNADPAHRLSIVKWFVYVIKTYSRPKLRLFLVGLGLHRLTK